MRFWPERYRRAARIADAGRGAAGRRGPADARPREGTDDRGELHGRTRCPRWCSRAWERPASVEIVGARASGRRSRDRARQDVEGDAAVARRPLGGPQLPLPSGSYECASRMPRPKASTSPGAARHAAGHGTRGSEVDAARGPAHRPRVRLRRRAGRLLERRYATRPASGFENGGVPRELLRPQSAALQPLAHRPRARGARPPHVAAALERRRPVRSLMPDGAHPGSIEGQRPSGGARGEVRTGARSERLAATAIRATQGHQCGAAQTWHGTTLKRLSARTAQECDPRRLASPVRARIATAGTCCSRRTRTPRDILGNRRMRSAPGPIWEEGYPRNDVLHDERLGPRRERQAVGIHRRREGGAVRAHVARRPATEMVDFRRPRRLRLRCSATDARRCSCAATRARCRHGDATPRALAT